MDRHAIVHDIRGLLQTITLAGQSNGKIQNAVKGISQLLEQLTGPDTLERIADALEVMAGDVAHKDLKGFLRRKDLRELNLGEEVAFANHLTHHGCPICKRRAQEESNEQIEPSGNPEIDSQ